MLASCYSDSLSARTVMISDEEKGVKRSKSRITGVLITNVSGTEKRTPIMIGKPNCPRKLYQVVCLLSSSEEKRFQFTHVTI